MSNGQEYSEASQEGRSIALALLEASAHVEGATFAPGERSRWVPYLFGIRARRLIRSALVLADADLQIEAAILLRSVVEYLITLKWWSLDVEAHDLLWRIDDLGTILRLGAAASAVGVPILEPEIEHHYQKARDEYRERLESLDDIDKRIPAGGRERLPSFENRAKQSDMLGLYSLAYRWDSLAAAHPNATAVEQFVERADGMFRLSGSPQHSLPDPYPVAALLLMMMLLALREVVDLQVAGLDECADRLRAIGAMDVAASPPDGADLFD